MSTALDILIRAKDEATRTIKGVGAAINDTSGKASKMGTASAAATSKVKTAFKGAGLAVAGGLTLALKTGFGEVQDYQTGLAQLQQGLKTTHGASGMTAAGMENLASKIQGYSGQTDDSIVATEQLLLTFTNIRNAAGKNNDIFTQTTKIAADMSARMGGDASHAAIQLGKALNDPVKGITALSRVGVSFDDQQKKQIAAFVKSGNVMGAQKIILKELNKEFGGSAKAVGNTLPGQINKLKRSWEDVTQQLVTALLPAFTQVVSMLHTALGFIQANQSWLGPLAAVLGSVGGVLFIVVKATRAWVAVQTALNVVMDANPIGLIVIAIAALAASLVIAYKKSETFRKIVHAAMYVVAAAFDFVRNHWKLFATIFATLIGGPIVGAIVLLVTHFGTIKSAAVSVKNGIVGAFHTVVNFIGGLPGKISKAASGMWDGIKNAFKSAINWIIHGWNSLQFTLPKVNTHIPGIGTIGGWTLGTPDIPYLANGGIATRATLAVVGEAGPEAIIPLSKAHRYLSEGGAPQAGIHVEIHNPVPEKASESVPKRLRELAYVNGFSW